MPFHDYKNFGRLAGFHQAKQAEFRPVFPGKTELLTAGEIWQKMSPLLYARRVKQHMFVFYTEKVPKSHESGIDLTRKQS